MADDECGGSKSVSSRSVAIVMVLLSVGRAHRGLRGDHPTASGPGLHRRAQRQRPERSGGRRAAAILLRDAKLGDQSAHAGYRVGCPSGGK